MPVCQLFRRWVKTGTSVACLGVWHHDPIRYNQILDFLKVVISSHQDHAVVSRCRGNPDVVLWQRPTSLLQALLQTSVFAGDVEIARDNGSVRRESLHLGDVLRRTG